MGYEAKVLADSLSPEGVRLTTLGVTYPHAVHKDIMTHRVFSRNFQSFRAFPPEKVIENIQEDPFIPEVFAARVKGMGQGDEIEFQEEARGLWIDQMGRALGTAKQFLNMDIAKQQVNFLLQDFTWISGIISATEWDNFWALRADQEDPKALPRPEVQKIAKMMKAVYLDSTPRILYHNEWHVPLVTDNEAHWLRAEPWDTDEAEYWKKVSVGRCARVSYLTHMGVRNPQLDIDLHDSILARGEMSPLEHVATPMTPYSECVSPTGFDPSRRFLGNFRGWRQYRKDIPDEHDYGKMKKWVK